MAYFELWGFLRVSSVNNFNVNVCYLLTLNISRLISTVLFVLFKTRSYRVSSVGDIMANYKVVASPLSTHYAGLVGSDYTLFQYEDE